MRKITPFLVAILLALSLTACSGLADLMGLSSGTNAPQMMLQYSADGTTAWSDTYTTGDNYMRTSVDGGTTWGDAMRITGSTGATGTAGATGATGAEGPSVYFMVGSEKIYSGGMLPLTSAAYTGAASYTTTTVSLVNNTGHVLTLTSSPQVQSPESWAILYAYGTVDSKFANYASKIPSTITDTMSSSIASGATSGNTFTIQLQGDACGAGTSGQFFRRFKVAVKDETTLETYSLSFVAYGLSGSY